MPESKRIYLFEQADSLKKIGDYTSSIVILNDMENDAAPDDVDLRMDILSRRADVLLNLGSYEAMFQDLMTVLKTDIPDSLARYEIKSYLILYDFYVSFSHFQSAEKYLNRAVGSFDKLLSQSPSEDSIVSEYRFKIDLARIILRLKQNSVQQVMALIENAQKQALLPEYQAMLELQRATALHRLGQSEQAMAIYNRVLDSGALSWCNEQETRCKFIDFLINENRLDDARNQLGLLKENTSNPRYRWGYFHYMSRLAEKERRTDVELAYLKRATQLSDSIDMAYISWTAKVESDLFEVAQTQLQASNWKRKNHLKSLWITILTVVLTLAIITVGWSVRRYTIRKRRQAVAENRLGNRNVEICSLNHRRLELEHSFSNIREILTSTADNADKISAIKNIVSSPQSIEGSRNYDIKNFDPVANEFVSKLNVVHPNLSNAEQRMAAMIFRNLSNKDIAGLINRSISTVKNIKKSLRRKLNVDDNLDAYLRNISAMDDADLSELIKRSNRQ